MVTLNAYFENELHLLTIFHCGDPQLHQGDQMVRILEIFSKLLELLLDSEISNLNLNGSRSIKSDPNIFELRAEN